MRSKFIYIIFILWTGCLLGMDQVPVVSIPFKAGIGTSTLTCRYDRGEWMWQKESVYFAGLSADERIEKVISQIPVAVLTDWQRMDKCERSIRVVCCPLLMIDRLLCGARTDMISSTIRIGVDFKGGEQLFQQYFETAQGIKGTVCNFLKELTVDGLREQPVIGPDKIQLTPMFWQLVVFLLKDVVHDNGYSSESTGSEGPSEEEFI